MSVSQSGAASTTDLLSTSHGRFGPFRKDAEHFFRQALSLVPDLAEAHLRLGRVLYLVDRPREADAEWQDALRHARSHRDTFVAYLASLFLGRLDEDEQHFSTAVDHYREALAIDPAGYTARLSLGRLLVTLGQDSEGWATIREGLKLANKSAPTSRDPWSAYGFEAVPWQLADRIADLREMWRR